MSDQSKSDSGADRKDVDKEIDKTKAAAERAGGGSNKGRGGSNEEIDQARR